MQKELTDFVEETIKNNGNGDCDLLKLALYAKKNDCKCPQCGKFEIVLGFLKYEKILTCKWCEQKRRFSSQHVSIDKIREQQLNLALGAI